ncbi:hypothetical protein ABPG72_004374 [Tetrahymena utriculariae]
MNSQNESDKFPSKQDVKDISSLEKKIKRLQIEKKRTDKRDNDIKKTFKATRIRYQKDQKYVMMYDNQMIQENEQSDYNMQQMHNELQMYQADIDDLLFEPIQGHLYQKLLNQIDLQLRSGHIENACQLLEQMNNQLLNFASEIKKLNNINVENNMLINGFSRYKNEPFIIYQLNSDINMHLPKLIEYGYLGLLQDLIKQFVNIENKHFILYQNNQFIINEKLTIKLFDTVKYLLQLLKIYKDKFLEINKKNQKQSNQMLDENEEGNLNNKHWLLSIFQIFSSITFFKPQIQNISQKIQSIQEKIQEIEELEICFISEEQINS